jgi:hypothetical protein
MKKFKDRQLPRRKYRFDIAGKKKALIIWCASTFKLFTFLARGSACDHTRVDTCRATKPGMCSKCLAWFHHCELHAGHDGCDCGIFISGVHVFIVSLLIFQ